MEGHNFPGVRSQISRLKAGIVTIFTVDGHKNHGSERQGHKSDGCRFGIPTPPPGNEIGKLAADNF